MQDTEQNAATGRQESEGAPGQEHEMESGQLLGEAFHEQIAQAMQPVVENVQRHLVDTLQHGEPSGELHMETVAGASPRGARADSSRKSDPHPAPTLAGGAAEQQLTSVLDGFMDVLFGDALRDAYEKHLQDALERRKGSRKVASDDSSGTEPALSEAVERLFSPAMQKKTRKGGEAAVRELLHGNASAARQKAQEAIRRLEVERLDVMQAFWNQAGSHRKESAGARQTAREEKKPAEKDSTPAETPHHEEIPQTILRSGARVQQLWTKARDRAAAKGDTGRRAERAGYDALKRQYEKKGDRWVKKQVAAGK